MTVSPSGTEAAAEAAAEAASADRVASLDLIRGIAVLGILAINIAGFAGPPSATLSPNLPWPGSLADEWSFAFTFLLFEGKMRALFSILFGAGIVLFVERADAAGRFGEMLEARRLVLLALFGLLHFYLLWWGDILFIYAVAGMIALMLREMAPRRLAAVALVLFAAWQIAGMAMSAPDIAREEHVRTGTATRAENDAEMDYLKAVDANSERAMHAVSGSFAQQALIRITQQTIEPVESALTNMGETLPLMLLGMALVKTGFFAGKWRRKTMMRTIWGAGGAGLILTLMLLDWAGTRHFPTRTMEAFIAYWSAAEHLLMALAYAAALILATPMLAASAPGRWLTAAGRMAFSNYIATTILMTWIFYGWGLGWMGRFSHAWQWPFVLLGWAMMLVWSNLWLAQFRRGPLEWLWRSLTEGRRLPFVQSRL